MMQTAEQKPTRKTARRGNGEGSIALNLHKTQILDGCSCYFPMQKRLKMRSRMSSV